jgi:hypothetical protein
LDFAVVGIAVGFAWYVSGRPMDFRVYYFGAQGVLDGTRPVYGEYSGIGWPMHYRYPPLFLLVAFPLSLLPLAWAAALWTLGKCAALGLLTRALWRRLSIANFPSAWIVPFLLAGPYVIEDLRYGNAQSFIFALVGAAFLSLDKMPRLAAAALALGISIKVWPLYFVPYLAVRRKWRVVGWTLSITALLTILPMTYFGFEGNLNLLGQWATQEFSIQSGQSEMWFPSQSLRGVMMRYLTEVDYSQVPDSNYQVIHLATINPNLVRTVWIVLATMGYCGFLAVSFWYSRKPHIRFGITEGLAFSTLVLFEPFSQKYALVVLLWPAIVAGRMVQGNPWRGLLYAAIAIVLIQPLAQGASAQRLLQVLGFDFLATALLTAFLLASIFVPVSTPSRGHGKNQ